ncbi:hypothetical protein THF1C08_50094 [Vibrio jasicida]|uniref:Uncharacterized protein n=1 Tax=Vibrio jasicida TaxID=766224 RepID=A0AAU9QUU9_9VIBR|nr:hypothetical protein THF1C08_50094 [Vibrio jasicida]CAH1601840.1 hypothetical protein THF1A12_50254 [Vibrio jasicida]
MITYTIGVLWYFLLAMTVVFVSLPIYCLSQLVGLKSDLSSSFFCRK